MYKITKYSSILLFITIMIFSFSINSIASDYPDKSLDLVVPWSSGGITDTTARAFAPHFEKHLKESVTIVNRPGASGAVGTEDVYRKKADGYTVLLSAETPATFQVMGMSELSFEDFEPIMMLVAAERVLVVPADSPYNNIDELIADIKKNPGEVKMSYSGPGASGHILGLLLEKANLDLRKIPAGGGHEAMIETISGRVDFTLANLSTVADYIQEGDLKALAVLDDEESENVDAPPLTKALPKLKSYLPLDFPNCLMVKKGTSEEKIEVLKKAAIKAANEDKWIEFTDNNYYKRMDHLTGEEVAEYWKNWKSLVNWMLYDAGVTENSPAEFDIPKFDN
ncbi:MAG: tripartite tricarboxylate transporter substrate binding protein [Bacillota bacterium]